MSMWNTLSSGIQMVQEKLALTDTDEETKVGALTVSLKLLRYELCKLQGVNEPDESKPRALVISQKHQSMLSLVGRQ